MPRSWAAPHTSEMIRDHLLTVGRDSIYGTWQRIKQQLEAMPKRYVPPTYGSLRVMFYCLRRLGLIRRVATRAASRKGYYRKSLYSVVPGKEDALEWVDPQSALYRPIYWEERKKAWIPVKPKKKRKR